MTTKEGTSGAQLSSQLWLPTFKDPFLAPEPTNQNHLFRLLARRTVGGVGAVVPRPVRSHERQRSWDRRSHAPYGPASILLGLSWSWEHMAPRSERVHLK